MAKITTKTTKENPLFENIALTFSGGGYRAATFSLGILSYFNQVIYNGKPLLEKVKGLSTVSGGTLTGATYAYEVAIGKSFDEFYTRFYHTLDNTDLLGIVLEKFAKDEIWKSSHKKRTIINAFALAYAELLTNGSFKDISGDNSHLKDICFNATDFSFGLAFRFQTTGEFGNYRLHNPALKKLVNKIKIADAIASSSCFPLGFEPIVMPDDFISDHNSSEYKALKASKDFEKGVGLMDGGIVDNQGIGSIIKADIRRTKNGDAYSLIMVCDVGSYMMDPWLPSSIDVDKKGRALSPLKVYNILVKKLKSFWWLVLPLPISALLLVYGFLYEPKAWIFIIGGAFAMFGLLAMGVHYLINYLEKTTLKIWDKLMNIIPDFMKGKLKYLKNLRLRLIARMLEDRGTSGKIMISDIFLKQIRRLNYNLFYADESLNNRRISAFIYELTEDQFKHGKSDEKEKELEREQIEEPSEKIFRSAKIATDMGTTLWFTKEDRDIERMKNLVSCGQYTGCYNLLKYCIDLKNKEDYEDPKELDELIKTFQGDWEKFRENPFWLHDASM